MPRNRDQDLLMAIGQRVSQARKDRGWTQEQLSEAIEIEPVSLSRLETGHRALSVSTLSRISDALGIGLGDLLDVDRPIPEPSLGPDEAEILRLFGEISKERRDLLLRMAREFTSS